MRSVEKIRPSQAPGVMYAQIAVVGVVLLGILSLVACFFDPAHSSNSIHAALLRGLQAIAVKALLRPLALHPAPALLLAGVVAYGPALYGLAGAGFRTAHLRWHALVSVPIGAGVAALLVFTSLTAFGLVDDHQLRYYAAAVLASVGAVLISAAFGWHCVHHSPKTVQQIADNPGTFDLEDLEGVARAEELKPHGDRAGLLLPFGDIVWPHPVNDAIRHQLHNRIVLGRYYDRKTRTSLWVCPEISNLKDTVVIAPPGSGKTYSIALPWSLELPQKDQSVFAIDVKGNMYSKLAPALKPRHSGHRHIESLYFDVAPEARQDSRCWNPLEELLTAGLTADKRIRFALGRDRLAEAIFGPLSPGENRHWDLIDLRTIKSGIELLCYIRKHAAFLEQIRGDAEQKAASLPNKLLKILKGAVTFLEEHPHFDNPTLHGLHDLFLTQETIAGYIGIVNVMRAYATWLVDRYQAEVKNRAEVEPEPTAPVVALAYLNDYHIFHELEAHLRGLYDENELKKRSFSERIEGVRNRLEPFGHQAVWDVTDTSNFTLSSLADNPCLFVCSSPLSLGLVGSSMAAMMARMIQHQMTARFKKHAGKTEKRLFMILDEFSKLKMGGEAAADFLSTSREAGCVSVIFLQDITQIREEVRQPILANCRDKYFLRGAGPDTAEWCSKALGTRRVPKASLSDSSTTATRSRSAAISASIAEEQAPVLRPREIFRTGGLKYGAWVVLDHYSHKPILVDMDREGGHHKARPRVKKRQWHIF